MTTKAPIRWYGGKSSQTLKIVPLLESVPHKRYIEPFGGSAAILLAKTPVSSETYNDLNSGLYSLFTVLSDDKLFKSFMKKIRALPYSYQMWHEADEKQGNDDVVMRAVYFFILLRQGFGGQADGWGYGVSKGETNNYWPAVSRLSSVHKRLKYVQVDNRDFRLLLRTHDNPDALFYLDPPYVMDTRKGGTRYTHEMTNDDHQQLVDLLLSGSSHYVLSGYEHDLYAPLVRNGWHVIRWETVSWGANARAVSEARGKRTECLYIAPATWQAICKVTPQQLSLF